MTGRHSLWAVALWALAAGGSAADKPARTALAATSPDALVIMRAPALDADYGIALSRYDPATATATDGWERDDRQLSVKAFARGPDYVYARMPPGTYVVNGVTQQRRWLLCYHAATVRFDVAAGQVLYLGSFDAAAALAQLQRAALAARQVSGGTFQFFTYFDGISPPGFAMPDDIAMANAEAFVHRWLPNVTAPLAAATLRPATFRSTHHEKGPFNCGRTR